MREKALLTIKSTMCGIETHIITDSTLEAKFILKIFESCLNSDGELESFWNFIVNKFPNGSEDNGDIIHFAKMDNTNIICINDKAYPYNNHIAFSERF